MKEINDFENCILPLLFNKANKNFNKQYDECLKPYGLSKFHAFYLIVLVKNKEGLTMNEINNFIGCDKANTSRAINDLQEKEIIFRDFGHYNEKKFLVKLTEKGYRIACHLLQTSKVSIESELSKLTQNEMNELFRLIKKIVD